MKRVRYIVDSSVFASILVKDEFYQDALRFLENHRVEELATLDLAYAETANVLWKHVFLLKRIHTAKYERLRNLLPRLVEKSVSQILETRTYLPAALDFAVENGIPVYDSLFITIAMDTGGRLVTFDEKLKEKLVELGISEIIYEPSNT